MIRLGNATVSLERREVFLDGQPLRLGARAFEILAKLIHANGRIVGKDELINHVWPDTIVEENNLQVQICALRKLFGDKAFIQTVPRRGYRLLVEASDEMLPTPRREIVLSAKASTFEASPACSAVQVFIIDDDPSVSAALSRLLRAEDIPHTLFSSAEAFLESTWDSPYACVLLDMNLPAKSGLELQTALIQAKSPWPIIFMTGQGTIPLTVQAMKAGASEFLTKPFDDVHFLDVLQNVRHKALESGDAWLQMKKIGEKYARLTNREKEVYSLVVNGLSHKEIAREIGTQEVTTKVHKKNIMDKMQSRSIIELVSMYNTIGLNRHPEDQAPA